MHLYIVDNKAKGRILKWVFQENKACQIFQKMNIFYPMIRTHKCAYQGLRNGAFFGKFGVLCFFFKTPVLRFALLPYYQQYLWQQSRKTFPKSMINHCRQLLLTALFGFCLMYKPLFKITNKETTWALQKVAHTESFITVDMEQGFVNGVTTLIDLHLDDLLALYELFDELDISSVFENLLIYK